MSGKHAEMSRWKWVLRNLGTVGLFLLGLGGGVGWALELAGDEMFLPWPMYPIGGALCLWSAVMRMIEDETRAA